MKICIDPGHGGQDPGAVGHGGTHEADITLRLAHALKDRIEGLGHSAYLTREADRFVELTMRAKIANVWGADRFLSIHCNGAVSESANGFEVWTSRGQTAADPIAENMFCAWLKEFPNVNGRRDLLDGDSDKEENFAVLRGTKMPAVLVETGFVTHPATEAEMLTEEWITAAAEALARGITAPTEEIA